MPAEQKEPRASAKRNSAKGSRASLRGGLLEPSTFLQSACMCHLYHGLGVCGSDHQTATFA